MLLLVCLSDCVCLSLCYLFYCVTMGLYPIQINGMEWNKRCTDCHKIVVVDISKTTSATLYNSIVGINKLFQIVYHHLSTQLTILFGELPFVQMANYGV